jgi:hypothetical protein
MGFPTCADPAGDEAIRSIIQDSVDGILQGFGRASLVSIILSGAMTQGEGTVLEKEDGHLRVLSDIDLYLVVSPEADIAGLKVLASKMARDLRERLPEDRMASCFDLAAVTVDDIIGVQPCIGTVDLRNRGRVIWGSDVLKGLPPLDPGQIPPRNAITLILNRVSEELMYRRAGSGPAVDMGLYHTTKTGADLALAILVLLREYRPTYRQRAALLREMWSDARLNSLRERVPDLPDKVARWTDQKLSPDFGGLARDVGGASPEGAAERLWLSLVPTVEAVWMWAMEMWCGRRGEDAATLAEEFGRMEGPRAKLRGWKQAWKRGDVGWDPGSLWRASLGVRRGSPVSLLYTAVLLVYLSAPGRNGLAEANRTTEAYLERARRLMPVAPPQRGDWDAIREVLVDHWRDTVMRGMR